MFDLADTMPLIKVALLRADIGVVLGQEDRDVAFTTIPLLNTICL